MYGLKQWAPFDKVEKNPTSVEKTVTVFDIPFR